MTDEPHGVDVGVELGGTKIVVGASRAGPQLASRTHIDTGDPETTLGRVAEAITRFAASDRVRSVGVGSFGPIDARRSSPAFGTIVATPKPGWSGVDVLTPIRAACGDAAPYAFATDVAAALVGERVAGAAQADDVAYLTVGTGVGGAIWSDGRLVSGANHPEMGHVEVPRHPDDDFPGACPFHGSCLEGMAAGPTVEGRFGVPGEHLGSSSGTAAALIAWYVAHGLRSIISVVPVTQVVIGGGAAKLPGFHDHVSEILAASAAGYPPVPFAEGVAVVPPGLGDDAGVVGAIEMGRAAAVARKA